jgi:transmembrane protein TMEM260 (protein O-mannosyltransferase)
MTERRVFWLGFAFALGLYLCTASGLITWAHFGEDGPELEGAARTLGIAHPPGYPLFTLLAHVLGFVVPRPWSAINVLTLLAAATAVGSAGLLILRMARHSGRPHATASALAGMGLFAVSPTWWSQASIGEVYTLHLAIITLGFALLAGKEPRDLLLAAYVFGLGLAHHPLTLPALLVALVYVIVGRRAVNVRHVVLLLLPLSLYLVLFLRAKWNPVFDWGDPRVPARLWWMMSGAQYHQNLLREGWQVALGAWVHALSLTSVTQLGWVGTTLVTVGAITLFRTARPELLWLSLLFVGSCFVGSAYDIPDPAAYFLPAVLALIVLAGMGFGEAWRACERMSVPRKRLVAQASCAGILAAGVLVVAKEGSMRATLARDTSAYDYALSGTETLEKNAIVLSRGDGRTFSLWYGSTVLRSRPDVVVVYESLLDWPWYRKHLAARYPDLLIPPRAPEAMRRYLFIDANLARRPVYVTEVPPDLARYDLVLAGPLFRVLGPVTARASNERTDTDPPPTPRK